MKRTNIGWLALAKVAVFAMAFFVMSTSVCAQSIVFEAEDFASSTNWATSSAPNTSGGQYIEDTEHTFNDRTLSPASYNVNVPTAGTYHLYARAFVTAVDPNEFRAPLGADQNDSFFIFDGFNGVPSTTQSAFFERVNELFEENAIGVEQWGWINASAGVGVEHGGVIDSPNYTYTTTAAGPHVFNIAGREDGLYLDVFVLSTVTDLSSLELDRLAGIPEPGCFALALSGLLGLTGAARRLRRL